MTTISRSRDLSTWDSAKQQQFRRLHSERQLFFHVLLDASPSMAGDDAINLRRAFNMYLNWLKRHGDPMSLAEVRCFSTELDASRLTPLGQLKPLTPQTYDPLQGDGTALYRAVGQSCATAQGAGQHVLIVFTDGLDNQSRKFDWTAEKVKTVLETLQEEQHWLAVFLGAFPEALEVGNQMGFKPGNCLVFTSDKIPEAFQQLLQATQKYLAAAPQERKLLAAGGIF